MKLTKSEIEKLKKLLEAHGISLSENEIESQGLVIIELVRAVYHKTSE